MIPILICVPFWQGDNTQAIDLCRILAGLQEKHAESSAHVMLICRQDFKIDPNMVKIISAKFNTFTYQSKSPLKGWPSGANGMFGSAMIYISTYMKGKYECVYWMEPDCTPLCPNWHNSLVVEWRRRPPNVNVVGCRHACDPDGGGDHITGCAIYHPRITRIIPEIATCDQMAWDYQHRQKIVAMGMHTKLIENWYRATNASPGILDRVNVGVAIIHGYKDDSVRVLVKKKYKIV